MLVLLCPLVAVLEFVYIFVSAAELHHHPDVISTHDVMMTSSSDQQQYHSVEEDERVVQAILVSHNGPQSFPDFKTDSGGLQTLGECL